MTKKGASEEERVDENQLKAALTEFLKIDEAINNIKTIKNYEKLGHGPSLKLLEDKLSNFKLNLVRISNADNLHLKQSAPVLLYIINNEDIEKIQSLKDKSLEDLNIIYPYTVIAAALLDTTIQTYKSIKDDLSNKKAQAAALKQTAGNEAEITDINAQISTLESQIKEMEKTVAYCSASVDETIRKKAQTFAQAHGIPHRQPTLMRQLISGYRDPTIPLGAGESPRFSNDEIKKIVSGMFSDEKPGFQAKVINDIKEMYNIDDSIENKVQFIKNLKNILSILIRADSESKNFPILSQVPGDTVKAVREAYAALVEKIKQDAEKGDKSLIEVSEDFESSIKKLYENNKSVKKSNVEVLKSVTKENQNPKTDLEKYIISDLTSDKVSEKDMDEVAKDVAEDLYNLSMARLQNVDLTDFWGKKFEKESSSIKPMSDDFNNMSAKIVNELLNAKNKAHQENIAKFYAKVFKQVVASGNYHMALAIGLGLNHGAVNRLHIITLPEVKEVIRELSSQKENDVTYVGLLSQVGSYNKLREQLKGDLAAGKAPIPILSMYLGDLTFYNENASEVDDPANPSKKIKNEFKMAGIGKSIREFQVYQDKAREKPRRFSAPATNIITGVISAKPLLGEADIMAYVKATAHSPKALSIKKETSLKELIAMSTSMVENYEIAQVTPSHFKVNVNGKENFQYNAYLEILKLMVKEFKKGDLNDQYKAFKLFNIIKDATTKNNLRSKDMNAEIKKFSSLVGPLEEKFKVIKEVEDKFLKYKKLKTADLSTQEDKKEIDDLRKEIANFKSDDAEVSLVIKDIQNVLRNFDEKVAKVEANLATFESIRSDYQSVKDNIGVLETLEIVLAASDNENKINIMKSDPDYYVAKYARKISIDREFSDKLETVLNEQLKKYLSLPNEQIDLAVAKKLANAIKKHKQLTNEIKKISYDYKKHYTENSSLIAAITRKLVALNIVADEDPKVGLAVTTPPKSSPIEHSLTDKAKPGTSSLALTSPPDLGATKKKKETLYVKLRRRLEGTKTKAAKDKSAVTSAGAPLSATTTGAYAPKPDSTSGAGTGHSVKPPAPPPIPSREALSSAQAREKWDALEAISTVLKGDPTNPEALRKITPYIIDPDNVIRNRALDIGGNDLLAKIAALRQSDAEAKTKAGVDPKADAEARAKAREQAEARAKAREQAEANTRAEAEARIESRRRS